MQQWIIAYLVDNKLNSIMQSQLIPINLTKQIHLQGRPIMMECVIALCR
jgi:hypothetical protein